MVDVTLDSIYSVDDQMLQFLDEFESCPDMYQRTIKRIEILEWGGKDDLPEERTAANTIECFVYSTTSCTLTISHEKKMHYIFVYGTLKKGQPNYHIMTDAKNGKTVFKGTGRTIEKYPLVIAQKANIPFLMNVPGTGHHISGEIYSVDDQMLQFLDEFESCPDMYQRTIKRIEILEWGGKDDLPEERTAANTIECFVYSTTSYQPEWLNLPHLDCYDSYGTHGLCYVTHLDR